MSIHHNPISFTKKAHTKEFMDMNDVLCEKACLSQAFSFKKKMNLI